MEHIADFTVGLKRIGEELWAEIQYDDQEKYNCSDARFYFYLVKDGVVIDRKGWFVENTYRWVLQESGVYFVQGYVRVGNERELRKSRELIYVATQRSVQMPVSNSTLPAKVSIFGSCTSRDLFRLFPSKDLELRTYVARQSVISAVSAPVALELEQIKLDSAFQKMAVWRDFNKVTFDLFREDNSDWLIIDLIDERFSPVRMEDSYVTKSSAAVESGIVPEEMRGSPRLWNGKDFVFDGNCLKDYVIRFVERVLDIYRPDHIIIHRALTVDQYWDAEGRLCEFSNHEKSMGKMINDMILYMYDLLKECIPEAHEIDCISRYYGSEQHHWGKATVHYEDGYYAEVMEEIKKIVCAQADSKEA